INDTIINDTIINDTIINDTIINDTILNETEEINDTDLNETIIPECIADIDCDDFNISTIDSCIDNNCSHEINETNATIIPECIADIDCEDNDSSTINKCIGGNCTYAECFYDSECADNNESTIDRCILNKCSNEVITYKVLLIPRGGTQASSFTINTQTLFDAGTYSNTTSNSTNLVHLWAAPYSQNDSMKLWLKFDNNSAYGENTTKAYDYSGNGNNATAYSTAAANSTGVLGNAAWFDGVDDYFQAANSASLNPTSQISIEAWIYSTKYPSYDTMVSKHYNSQWAMMFYSSDRKVRFDLFPFYYYNHNIMVGAIVLSANAWHHIACTFDGTNGRIYVDSVLDITGADVSGSIDTTTNALRIGGDSVAGLPFGTYIDEVAIYNRSLSADEIKSHFRGGTGTYTSAILDAGGAISWKNISWTNTTGSDSNITVQVRTCSDSACSAGETFIGYDNTSATYFNNSVLNDLSVTTLNRNRYFQFKAYFVRNSTNGSSDAILNSVTIGYENSMCSSGNLSTTCYLNHIYNVSSGEVISGVNLDIQSGGMINSSGLNFTLNFTGNITVESGGAINANGTAGTSPTVGGNITIVADILNVSGNITSNGGYTSSHHAYSSQGGIINITTNSTYVSGTIEAKGGGPIGGTSTQNKGGGGGTININCTVAALVSGVLNVSGGDAYYSYYDGGNGGTINVTATSLNVSGNLHSPYGSGRQILAIYGDIYLNYGTALNFTGTSAPNYWIPDSKNCGVTEGTNAVMNINYSICNLSAGVHNYTSLTITNNASIYSEVGNLTLNVTGLVNVTNYGSISKIKADERLTINAGNLTISGVVGTLNDWKRANGSQIVLNVTDNLIIDSTGIISTNTTTSDSNTPNAGNLTIISNVLNVSGTISAIGGKTKLDHGNPGEGEM
ncbi:MAG: LamG domain-containing protein, partial [Candidatus Paceibacterota bacterium]